MKKINLILLAAGNSRRFGRNKLLLEFEGKPLYRHMLDKLVDLSGFLMEELGGSYLVRVFLITQYEEILEGTRGLPLIQVESLQSFRGLSYSIQAAVRAACMEEGDFIAFFTADMPWLKRESILGFLKGFLQSGCPSGCVRSGERWGNPAIFSWSYVDELNLLQGDQGGKQILRREECFFYPISAEEWKDIDLPEDLME